MTQSRNLPETEIKRVIERILETRRITKADQAQFMRVMLAKGKINESERLQIDLIFDKLKNGRLKVVD
jgi:hypothetical protein